MSEGTAATMKGVTEQIRLARDHVVVGVADAVNSGVDAARIAKEKVGDSMESLLDQGKDLADDTADLIRNRPWTTVGIALAAGYVIAKLSGRR